MYFRMRMPLIIIISLFFCISCSEQTNNSDNQSNEGSQTHDTIVGSNDVIHEIAGSSYMNRATAYYVVYNHDTSLLKCYFSESKSDKTVLLSIYFQESLSYRQQYSELDKIIPFAGKEYNLDSLTTIFIGRLIGAGDLAIDISNQFKGENISIEMSNYDNIAGFLLNTKLTDDVNNLLSGYSKKVAKISPEKVMIINGSDIFRYSRIETDTAKIPDEILDCMTWLVLN